MKFRLFSFLLIWAFVPLASAQEASPDAFVKGLSEDVIAAIRQDKDIQAGDADKISALVEAKILPHFDFRRTTQVAMGVNWRRASADQQERLTSEFKLLLVRTYSGALASYRDQVIEFKPLRASPGDAEVTVRSQVKQSGAEPITIDYAVEKTASGWKIFDVSIGGISLAANYRTAFGEEVRNHGVDGLIALLADKNRQAIARPRRAATLAGSS
jgi:phospholipid transport system substrate-binding protein